MKVFTTNYPSFAMKTGVASSECRVTSCFLLLFTRKLATRNSLSYANSYFTH